MVNEQFLVEKIYERELLIAAQLEKVEEKNIAYNFPQSIQCKLLSATKQQLKKTHKVEIFSFWFFAKTELDHKVNNNVYLC